MLELHIWGPAFGLPSFDAECIAATALLNTLLRSDEWILIPAHDTITSPTGDFPLLLDGSASVTGFSAIVKHLSLAGRTLDSCLTSHQRADSVALSNHIAINALPLLAYHLHTSPETYSNTTLPAISSILPISIRHTLSRCLHATAVARAAAAGLSYVDDATTSVEVARAGSIDPGDMKFAGASPSLIFKREETLQAALRKEQSKMRFRVEAALEMLLEPVADKLKQVSPNASRRYLVGKEHTTSLDCLTFGYMSLLFFPKVHTTWLTGTLEKKYPIVVEYITSLRSEFLGGAADIDAQVVMKSPSNFFSLPWRTSIDTSTTSLISTWTTPLTHLLIPSLSTRGLIPISAHLSNDPFNHTQRPPLWLLTATFTAGPTLLGCLAYYLFHYAQREWVGWGGGERDKTFYSSWRGTDAEDVLSALFGPGLEDSMSPGYPESDAVD